MSEVTKLPWFEELTKLLGREPECENPKEGVYIALCFIKGGPFTGGSPEEALRKLYEHLISLPPEVA